MKERKGLNDAEAYYKIYGDKIRFIPFYAYKFNSLLTHDGGPGWEVVS